MQGHGGRQADLGSSSTELARLQRAVPVVPARYAGGGGGITASPGAGGVRAGGSAG
ncbi:MAG: hypothetical protein HC925_01655 [Coleofasciculaceae cyanobacterium SM2_3_26]|nr:hypothetical protein [Coleofasciculaceae cyanobacterium SM2_3_26]